MKIKLLSNRVQDLTQDITFAISYAAKHGIQISFDIEHIDVKGYQSSYIQVRPTWSQWILTGAENLVPLQPVYDVVIFAFDINEWKSSPGSTYPLLPSTPSSDCITHDGKPFINLGIYPPDETTGMNHVTLCHELMHAYTKIANAKGFNIQDQMDTYYMNQYPDFPTGNFAIQWNLLQPFIKSLHMNVTIKRLNDNGKETLGVLTYGDFTCSTLERPWLNNQHNISCIPFGTYHCSLQPFHDTKHYELANVPNRTGVFIHPGNFYADSLGCILLGVSPSDINHDGQVDVTNSQFTVKTFEALLDGKDFTLVIE